MISSESHNGRVRCDREKGFSYEGTRRSVMLNDGPVNKNQLPEPTDNCETFTARYRRNFVQRVGRECNQQTRFAW